MNPYKQTIRQYLGIPEKHQLIPTEFRYTATWGENELKRGIVAGVKPDDPYNIMETRPTAPVGIEFRRYKNDIGVAFDKQSNRPVGFMNLGTPVCIRKREGIGSHMVAHFNPIYPNFTRSYSESGYYNRIAAHALLVTWACLDGLNIPQIVLDEYCVYRNRLRLRERLNPTGHGLGQILPAEKICDVYK